jgi:hypothetical protein
MNILKLEDNKRSYIKVIIFGLLIGFMTEIINSLPSSNYIY